MFIKKWYQKIVNRIGDYIMPDEIKGQSGIDKMLAENPGSEVTDEQRARIEKAADKMNRISGSPRDLVVKDLTKSKTLEDDLKIISEFPDKSDLESESLVLEPEDMTDEENGFHEVHKWKRGILPGGKYIKTCQVGGESEVITHDEWMKTP